MPTPEWLAEQFEQNRAHLRAVAYRMLGSVSEAEDAVQEAWIRLGRSDVSAVENLRGWLTTVVSRVCLDVLRSRKSRGETPLDDVFVPDPVVTSADDPESGVIRADSIGMAMLIVLETLEPAERLAFVLHDAFGMTFDEIAPIVERTPVATRQLASRARRRLQGGVVEADRDLHQQRRVVDAFLAAAREGDFERLVTVLDPDIVLRADAGRLANVSKIVRGIPAFAEQATTFSRLGLSIQVVLVNGNIGLVSRRPDGKVFSVIGLTIAGGKIAEMNILADPDRLARIDLSAVVS
jgi:RNA polymerase sigma factor (sigma-70 family)